MFTYFQVVTTSNCGPQWRSWYGDTLQAGRSGDRIPVEARSSAPVQSGPVAHQVSQYNGYRVSFREVKWPGSGVKHPPTSSADAKEIAELCLYSPSGPSWPVLGQTSFLPQPVYSSPALK